MTAHTTPRNILVIQLGDIGDVVLATASFRALKDLLPGARIHAVVRKGCSALLAADPNLNGVFESRRGSGRLSDAARENLALARALRAERFDLVIDLRTGDRSAILAFLVRGVEKVAYAGDGAFWRRFVYTRLFDRLAAAPPPAHPGADQSLRILRAAGLDVGNFLPQLHVSDETDAAARGILSAAGISPGRRFVTVNPFSRWKYKEWGYDRWAEVIARLGEQHGLPSVLIGSAEESGEAAGILRKAGREGRSIAGKTTLGELAAVLRRSTLHLGVDSAAPHIASAVGTPTLTIFGPSDWRAWVVPDDLHRVVTPDMECVPCHRKGCDGKEKSLCLEKLPAEKVLGAAEEILLAEAARTTPPSR
ncbi:glycosyltransferase family 9 protein [Candidatus Deferrimicrobium sp.]|uniref:glycosyltransferase family 9 protein n=1 Tax=Candidatus Deferrimicrobium sp. TaxID=3060586 RepID=UPI002ED65D32